VTVLVDGAPAAVNGGTGSIEFEVPAGQHRVSIAPR
jgi:uncharacterized Zn-binding protein involved in type VI secretion